MKKRKNAAPSPLLQNYIKNKGVPQNQGIQPSSAMYQPNSMTQSMNVNGMNMNQNSAMNINSAAMPAPSVQNSSQQNDNSNKNNETIEPQRSYIPSSKPADFSNANNAEAQRFNNILADMDKTEKEFSKYLSI